MDLEMEDVRKKPEKNVLKMTNTAAKYENDLEAKQEAEKYMADAMDKYTAIREANGFTAEQMIAYAKGYSDMNERCKVEYPEYYEKKQARLVARSCELQERLVAARSFVEKYESNINEYDMSLDKARENAKILTALVSELCEDIVRGGQLSLAEVNAKNKANKHFK